MKPGFYQFAHIAFQCFGALLALTFGVKASAEGIRNLVPFLGMKYPYIVRFIVRDSATLVATFLIMLAAFCTHFLVRDYVLVNGQLHREFKPNQTPKFLWSFALGIVALDAYLFFSGISELTLWDKGGSKISAIVMTLLYVCMFPVFAFINLYLSLKAKG